MPLLVRARASFLHACEWNPAAVEALRRNLRANGVPEERYRIHEGDNRLVCPAGVADRVCLGLLPTAEASYAAAVAALRPDRGGILHVHGNVGRGREDVGEEEAEARFKGFMGPEFRCKFPGWQDWATETADKIQRLWAELKQCGTTEQPARVELMLLTRVKSYAPRVDHLVLDLRCC